MRGDDRTVSVQIAKLVAKIGRTKCLASEVSCEQQTEDVALLRTAVLCVLQMVCLPEFAQLVQEDAKTVQHRQETDSIAIIDDIRFHITNYVQTYSDMYEADQKLAIIDAFLEELELDG